MTAQTLLLDLGVVATPALRSPKGYAKTPPPGTMLIDGRHRAQVWAQGVRNNTKWCVDEKQRMSLWGAERGTGAWRFLGWQADIEAAAPAPDDEFDQGFLY